MGPPTWIVLHIVAWVKRTWSWIKRNRLLALWLALTVVWATYVTRTWKVHGDDWQVPGEAMTFWSIFVVAPKPRPGELSEAEVFGADFLRVNFAMLLVPPIALLVPPSIYFFVRYCWGRRSVVAAFIVRYYPAFVLILTAAGAYLLAESYIPGSTGRYGSTGPHFMPILAGLGAACLAAAWMLHKGGSDKSGKP